ncbi:MAG TPA: VCBS repeat-containing protein, partial [Bacteroidota bacterium]|nr:VCBS repeat-containing protein [Bacteroidota bacterium]
MLHLTKVYAQTHLTTFGRILELKTNQNAQDLLVGDFNGDGMDDLATYGGTSIQFLFQNDSSIAWHGKNLNINKSIIGAVAAQCNNDRITDIVVATEDPDELQVFLTKSQFPSQPRWKQILEVPFEKFSVADINNDGKVDILLYGKRIPGIIIYTGRGDGTFKSSGTLFSDYSFNALHINDWNRDGINDIFVSHWISNEVLIFSGFGRMKFSEPARISFSSEPSFLTTTDFNTDENVDLVIGFTEDRLCEIMFGDGLGNFKQSQILQLENFPTAILTGDMNRDGKVDIGILNETEHSYTVRLNDGDGLFHDEINFSAGKIPTRAQLFRHEKKSNYNLAILDQALSRVRLFYNTDVKNYFPSQQTYCTGLQPTNVLTFDV